MKWWVLLLISILTIVGVGVGVWVWLGQSGETGLLSPGGSLVSGQKEKPLEKFTFDHLAQREYQGSQINLKKVLAENDRLTSYLFTYLSDGKRVSGLANIPKKITGKAPVVIMLRGYVDQAAYKTGVGTWKAAEVFARNGYITLAPDFLGFGESEMPENDVWWERLNRPVQVLNLIASVDTLPQADAQRIGIWAHSNGGQIALSVLEITQRAYPTTLWAPVSKPFPYSILYYTDEFDDEGKALRAELAQFEQEYDVRQYSVADYLKQIKAPLQIHQGTVDDAVPQEWSDELVEKLETLEKEVDYFVYPGADHNMVGSWDTVVARDLAFFKEKLR